MACVHAAARRRSFTRCDRLDKVADVLDIHRGKAVEKLAKEDAV